MSKKCRHFIKAMSTDKIFCNKPFVNKESSISVDQSEALISNARKPNEMNSSMTSN